MLQLANRTPLAAELFATPDPDGVEALHAVVCATFALTPDAPLVAEQRPVKLADTYEGDGEGRWLRRAGVVHPAKPGWEVLVEGEAVAPRGEVEALDASVSVGAWERALRVTGDRAYTGQRAPFCTAPAPFRRMPLTPTRAFGGRIGESGPCEVRNPSGVGHGTAQDPTAVRGLPLPNLEDPKALIRQVGDAPAPRWLGPVAPWWSPRAARAGTYDATWERERAPFLPRDFDPRFAMVTSDDAWPSFALRGAEPIVLRHLAEAARVDARVPALELRVSATFRGSRVALPVARETLLLLPGEGVGVLTFRAVLRCGHRVLDVSEVEIDAEGLP